MRGLLPWAVLVGFLGASLAHAQEAQRERPSVRMPKVDGGPDLEIDGVLDEALWDQAAVLGDLTQTLPVEGQAMGVETRVLLAYDANFVYVGLDCEELPGEVRARQMDRDAFVRYDDVVELWFDPFASDRFAYWFQVTPGGSIGDALISDNGTSFNKDWDGIWYGRSVVTARGWTAELAFPLKTLAFDPNAPYWGFNILRKRVGNGEQGRWASPSNAYPFFQISDGGRLTGMEGLKQGLGLDVVPYVKFQADRGSTERSFGSEWDTGATIRWRPSPTATLLVTTNTDFAETEVDTRQINTNRFPLFFPERRDFFLEEAGVFEFGAPSNRSSLVPFFSRRVGRGEAGEVVPILAGVKLTGRFGDWTVGALDTYLGDVAGIEGDTTDLGRQNLGVIRVQRGLGEGSQIGMVATTGDPAGDGSRTTLGLDARFGSPRLFGEGRSGFLWAYVLGTTGGDGPEAGEGLAYGVEARARSTNWAHEVRVARTEEDFSPALGFVRRTGFDQGTVESDYTWRSEDEGSLFRQVAVGGQLSVIEDTAGEEDSWSVPLDLFEAQFWSQDSIDMRLTRQAETIDTNFNVGDSATVVAGDYDETQLRFGFESNDRRRVGLEASYQVGDYFGGTIKRLRAEPIFIPSKHLSLGMSFQDVAIDLDENGTLHTQLYGFRVDVGINPDASWRTFAQYDTDAKDLSVQSRLRWILEPGRELFLVALAGFNKENHRAAFTSSDQSLALKIEATFRF